MLTVDLSDKCVLVTGGTKGIGRGIALQFAKAGARVYITYRWGSADQEELLRAFAEVSSREPVLMEADVSVDADTDRLLNEIAKSEKSVDVLVANASIALLTQSVDEYSKRSLFKTIEYSSWPLVEYPRKIHSRLGQYPKYILGISSDGPDHFYQGYDYVAASKALLEVFAKYLSMHFFASGSRVNIIRFGTVQTDSFNLVFGPDFFDFLRSTGISDDMFLNAEDCGKSAVALCSGLMDAVNGQILTIDKGMSLRNNLIMQYLFSKSSK